MKTPPMKTSHRLIASLAAIPMVLVACGNDDTVDTGTQVEEDGSMSEDEMSEDEMSEDDHNGDGMSEDEMSEDEG